MSTIVQGCGHNLSVKIALWSNCFSSQKLPYSSASVFVLWGSSPYNPKIIKKPSGKNT